MLNVVLISIILHVDLTCIYIFNTNVCELWFTQIKNKTNLYSIYFCQTYLTLSNMVPLHWPFKKVKYSFITALYPGAQSRVFCTVLFSKHTSISPTSNRKSGSFTRTPQSLPASIMFTSSLWCFKESNLPT